VVSAEGAGGLVDYAVDGPVATITMDDGKVNALSPAMLAALNSALDRAGADAATAGTDGVRTVVLRGRPGVFSAGFDLKVLRAGGHMGVDMLLGGFELSARLLAFPLPLLGACTGHALAMGSFLLLSLDTRIGTTGDYRIGANEVAIGLTMPAFGVEICRQRLTPAHFNRAVITAEIYSPEQAVEAGFLDAAVAEEDFEDVVATRVTQLCALDLGAHAGTKLAARGQALRAIREAIASDRATLRGQP
jgi:enoyl-CoA hydratase